MTLHQRSLRSRGAAIAVMGLMAVIAGAMLSSAVFAQAANTDTATAFTVKKRAYRAGDVSRYRLSAKIQAAGPMGDQDVAIQMRFIETVKAAKPSGELSLLLQFESGIATLGGQDQDVLAVLPLVALTRDKEGKVSVKTSGGTPDGAAELGGLLLQMSTAVRDFAPDKTVKPGDKWQVSFENPNKIVGGSKVEAEAELLDTETIGGIKTLKIRFKGTSREGADAEKAPIEGTLNIESETGRLVRITEKGAGAFAGGKAKADLEMSLAPSEEKPAKP